MIRPSTLQESRQEREQQQSEKTERGFQEKENRKVEPHPVRIVPAKDKCRPAAAEEDKQYSTKIDPAGEEQSPEGFCERAAAQKIERSSGLMQRKNKIEDVDEDRGIENPTPCCAPAQATPGLRFGLVSGLTKNGSTAKVQDKS